MEKGKVEYAIRQALNNFDEWNEATGVIPEFCGYYYEAQECIRDAVRIGIMAALDIKIEFDEGGNLIDKV
jgi:hypothetical protein